MIDVFYRYWIGKEKASKVKTIFKKMLKVLFYSFSLC